MTGQSALYTGRVMHQRLSPARHRLQYRVFSLLIDLDELAGLDRRLRLFSVNRFNLFSLHEKDYGGAEGLPMRQHVEQQLARAGLAPGGRIQLLTMPRILGYAFNPLTVYFCHRPDGALQALLYEVNNTFGERHSYLIAVPEAEQHATRIRQSCDKEFHVSPFLGLSMRYAFDIALPAAQRDHLGVGITASDANGPVLVARFHARRRPLDDRALARTFLTHPLLTLKVMGAIHWEALKLWIKRVPLHTKPPAPALPVTIIKTKDL